MKLCVVRISSENFSPHSFSIIQHTKAIGEFYIRNSMELLEISDMILKCLHFELDIFFLSLTFKIKNIHRFSRKFSISFCVFRCACFSEKTTLFCKNRRDRIFNCEYTCAKRKRIKKTKHKTRWSKLIEKRERSLVWESATTPNWPTQTRIVYNNKLTSLLILKFVVVV